MSIAFFGTVAPTARRVDLVISSVYVAFFLLFEFSSLLPHLVFSSLPIVFLFILLCFWFMRRKIHCGRMINSTRLWNTSRFVSDLDSSSSNSLTLSFHFIHLQHCCARTAWTKILLINNPHYLGTRSMIHHPRTIPVKLKIKTTKTK